MHAGFAIIKEEHRTLAAVLDGLLHLTRAVGDGKMKADVKLLGALLDYIELFPLRLHHPKEDQFLFPALRRHGADANAVLDELQREHGAEPAIVARMQAALAAAAADPAAFPAFAAEVEHYGTFLWHHMSQEENQVMPLAAKLLTDDDWAPIDRAFQDNDDPLFGLRQQDQFQDLFRRILALAPAPYGFA